MICLEKKEFMSNQLIICMPNNGFEIQMTDFILEQNLYVGFIYLLAEYVHKCLIWIFVLKEDQDFTKYRRIHPNTSGYILASGHIWQRFDASGYIRIH